MLATAATPSGAAKQELTLSAIGFLTVLNEGTSYVGGYLVTNAWGRPLEFRLTSAVQPNRVQQVLYAGTLEPYLCGELIGKTLLDKTATAVQLVVTDREEVLALRLKAEVPIIYLPPAPVPRTPPGVPPVARPALEVVCHPHHPGDAAHAHALLDALTPPLDLLEPFARVREAIAEARKLRVSQ